MGFGAYGFNFLVSSLKVKQATTCVEVELTRGQEL